MEVDFALLATAAEASGGKISMLGAGFDRLAVAEMPATPLPFVVAVRFLESATIEDEQTHDYRLEITSPSGETQMLVEEGGAIRFTPRDNGTHSKAAVIMYISHTFSEVGVHWFTIYVDGKQVKDIDLDIQLQPQS